MRTAVVVTMIITVLLAAPALAGRETISPAKSSPKDNSGSYDKGYCYNSAILTAPADVTAAWSFDVLTISWAQPAYGDVSYSVKCVSFAEPKGCAGYPVATVTYIGGVGYKGDDDSKKGRSGTYSSAPSVKTADVADMPEGASCYFMATDKSGCRACFAIDIPPKAPKGCWVTDQATSDPNCAGEATTNGWRHYTCYKDQANAADLGTCMRKYVLAGYGSTLLPLNFGWNWGSDTAFSSMWSGACNLANFGPAGIVNDRIIECVSWGSLAAIDYTAVDGVVATWVSEDDYAALRPGLLAAFQAGQVDVIATEDNYVRYTNLLPGDFVSRAFLGVTSSFVPDCGTCALDGDGSACNRAIMTNGVNIPTVSAAPAATGPFGAVSAIQSAYATTLMDPALVTSKGGTVAATMSGAGATCLVAAGGEAGVGVAFFPRAALGATAGRFVWASDSEYFSNDYYANNGNWVLNTVAWLSEP